MRTVRYLGWRKGVGSACLALAMVQAQAAGSGAEAVRSYRLSVTLSGAGSVSSQPAGIACGTDCVEDYAKGTRVTLRAQAAAGYGFKGWTGGGCGNANPCTVLMNRNRTIAATFLAQVTRHSLSVTVNGPGRVASVPAGIDCGSDCQESYGSGTAVILSATPEAGGRFLGWTGEGLSCPGTGSCELSMTRALAVSAAFEAAPVASGVTRVSVSGFGHVASSDGSLSCGPVPASLDGASSSRCVSRSASGSLRFTATPYNERFRFSHWLSGCTGSEPSCELDVSRGGKIAALFVPAAPTTDLCEAMGLVSDRLVRRLDGHFPALAVGQSFTDPKFGTTLRRVTAVKQDGRGSHNVLKTLYSTISAWNADESYLILYRTDGGPARHELFDGKTYRFIRALEDIRPVDLEQVYWDTQDPDLLYYATRTDNTLYRYRVSSQRSEAIRVFDAQCGSRELHGGGDPIFNAWDSSTFGLACVPNGVLFSYDLKLDRVGRTVASSYDYGAPQATPSGRRFFMNENNAQTSNRAATVRDADMNVLRTLDLESGNEHGTLSMLSNGQDTWNAVAFGPGPGGSGMGTLVQSNLETGAARVLVGPSLGYPYPPSGTHIGATAFHRSGLVAVSVKDDMKGDSLLDDELLFVDTDPVTNPAASVCRVGHHRTTSDNYWAEPHPSISPSGTRVLFSSSWGDSRDGGQVVDVFVLELPGYKP